MDKPFFSVLVPAHNAEGFIRKGLDRIREQSFQDYELIVVCDKCSDKTAEVVSEYIQPGKDKLLVGDFKSSKNELLDNARGEWVLFMDHDDWFLHEYVFEMIAKKLKGRTDIDLLAFGFIWKGFGYRVNTARHIYPVQWSKAWRRDFIGDERFPIWSAIDDYGFAVKMHPKARFEFWDMPIYYYNYMQPGSGSEKMLDGTQSDFSDLPPYAQESARRYIEAMKKKAF